MVYKAKRPIEHANASLKIVPYCVMKKPSDPSLIGALTSFIRSLPGSLSRIQHNSQKLTHMNESDTISAENAMRLEVVLEMSMEKVEIRMRWSTYRNKRMNCILSD